MNREEVESVATALVDCFVQVHQFLGPGLLESTDQSCLALELRSRGIEVKCEVALPVRYKEIEI